MSFPWKIALGTGAALGVLGVIKLVTRGSVSPKPERVALIGDSYAVGLGPELAKLLRDFKYEGHVGTNTSEWAAHAARCGQCGDWLTAFKPDVVLVALGVNDGKTPNQANYQTIVRGLHGIGARVVWIEPPAAVDAPAARKAIDSLGVLTVPATQVSVAADKLKLHPSPAGYQTWAGEIVQTLGRDDLLPLRKTA